MIHQTRRAALVRELLTAILIYQLISLEFLKWVNNAIVSYFMEVLKGYKWGGVLSSRFGPGPKTT